MEKYIFEHYYLVYAAPTFLIGIICIVYGAINGTKLERQYLEYWPTKLNSRAKDNTDSLKGKLVSYSKKRALKAFEEKGEENHRLMVFYRVITWFGIGALVLAVVWGYLMRTGIINQL